MRPGYRRVRLVSLGSFRCALRVVGFIRVRHWGRRAHSASLGSFWCALGSLVSFEVVGFIRVCPSLGVIRFIRGIGFVRVHPGAHRVHSGSLG